MLLLLRATVSAAGPGTSAASFLAFGYGARPLGLGEAFVAISDDVSALHYNPAGLAYPAAPGLEARSAYEMIFSRTMHVQDISMDQFGIVRRPFGLSVANLRVGDIERRASETAAPDGTFEASDLSLGLSYGRKARGTGLGVTLKLIRQSIGGVSAQAYAMDMGLLRRFKSLPLSLGAGVSNLGTKVRFIEQEFSLPLTLRAGVTAGMTKSFPHAISLQVDVPRDSSPALRLGVEYLGFGPFALRMGYRTFAGGQRDAVLGKALGSSASGLTEFYGMFMGVGVRSKLGTLDYAILPYGELGQAHRLSFGFRFGQPQTKDTPK